MGTCALHDCMEHQNSYQILLYNSNGDIIIHIVTIRSQKFREQVIYAIYRVFSENRDITDKEVILRKKKETKYRIIFFINCISFEKHYFEYKSGMGLLDHMTHAYVH